MTDRKKPGVAFCATVAVVVVLVGYPLSLGPALWIYKRVPEGMRPPIGVYCAPARWCRRHSKLVNSLIESYTKLWKD